MSFLTWRENPPRGGVFSLSFFLEFKFFRRPVLKKSLGLTITSDLLFTKTNYCPLSLYTKIMVSHRVSLLKETGCKYYDSIKSAPDIWFEVSVVLLLPFQVNGGEPPSVKSNSTHQPPQTQPTTTTGSGTVVKSLPEPLHAQLISSSCPQLMPEGWPWNKVVI